MGLNSVRIIPTICRNCMLLHFPVALLFVLALTGCNTCVTFSSNPPNGTLGIVSSDPRSACTITKVTSAVRLRLAAEPVCTSCAGSAQVQHIFIGIQGIELNQNAAARDDSPDWQELLPPELEQKPLQIDLMEGKTGPTVQPLFGKIAMVSAGIYRQLRVRLTPNRSAMEDRLPAQNMCGGGTFNCIVMANGRIQPLQLNEASSALRITSDRMEGASLPLLHDTHTDLIIEMKLVWELSSSADTGVRLLPTLTSSARVRRINLNELGTPEDGVVSDSQSR